VLLDDGGAVQVPAEYRLPTVYDQEAYWQRGENFTYLLVEGEYILRFGQRKLLSHSPVFL